jgi:hypothetical protein
MLLSVTGCVGAQGTGSDSSQDDKLDAFRAGGGADAPVDLCARRGWYGDGECDTFCELPDRDCESTEPGEAGGGTEDTGTDAWQRFAEAGRHEVRMTEGRYEGRCEVRYELYAPASERPTVLAVLAHGFRREPAQMAGHAVQLASWGLTTLVPRLCERSLLGADHTRNGLDVAEVARVVADEVGATSIVHVGFSAGGGSALAACADEPRCVGVLGLDPVGDDRATTFDRPDVARSAIFGEPQRCNRDNDALGLWRDSLSARVVRIPGATHADFESPTAFPLDQFCGEGPEASSDSIRLLLTAFALYAGGIDPTAEDLWRPGTPAHDALVERGLVRAIPNGDR